MTWILTSVQNFSRDIWNEENVHHRLDEFLSKAFSEVWDWSVKNRSTLRVSAVSLGVIRVLDAHHTRGLYP